MKPYLKRGEWNAICDECGFKFKASELRERWDGLRVCTKDFELRHPQDLIKIPKEIVSVPWTRPESTDVFVSVPSPITTEDGTDPDYAILTEDGIPLFTES